MNNRVKIERVTRGLTQQALAQMIGVSRQTIHAIESGRYVPSTLLALRLSEVFGKTVNEIFQLVENEIMNRGQ